ncbi:hypothetical protein [Paenibacillus sp. DCT19]|uniref:hypothetical protein n=1 Tax=Paenibacillus sp. DCT19 TaxID=2211212 RepID=UPI0034A04331
MKITDFSILFVIIFLPLFWIVSLHTRDAEEAQLLSQKYRSALQTAVLDAGAVMHQNEKQNNEAGYDSTKFVKADKELALLTFTQTMALNMEFRMIRLLFDHYLITYRQLLYWIMMDTTFWLRKRK